MTSLHRTCGLLIALVLFASSASVLAIQPSAVELSDANRFASAKFLATAPTTAPAASITVLSNHGPVQQNHRGPEPIRIGAITYQHGLYCHAYSKLLVTLPVPAKSFHATVGVDARAGGGSIEFLVHLGPAAVYRSGVMHIDTPAKTIDVDLKSFREFTLEISDTGDGITSDQGNWADATITLQDGSQLNLGDLPIAGPTEQPLSLTPPLSFTYDAKSSADLLPTWKCDRVTTTTPDSRHHTVTYTDPKTNLIIRLEATELLDSPVVEWTPYFKNAGTTDTPILENIRALDTALPRLPDDPCTFHYHTGDHAAADSYEPHVDPMPAGYAKHIANTGGRPTQEAFPYFNLTTPTGGAILAIGWPGQWSADFSRDASGSVHLSAGQELTHFRLHPGEEVRGPRIVLQFYRGDPQRGQNLFRHWMLTHNMRQPGGKPMPPIESICTGNAFPGQINDAPRELAFLKQHIDAGFTFDIWWEDAGWYPCDTVTWPKTGTWEVDPVRFPKGLREISDYVHAHNMKSLLWVEPERVYKDTWLADNHPEWIHGGKAGGLLRLDLPECRTWLTDHIDRLMKDQGIDNYRQDFNIDPLPYWRKNDPEDRQGITEIKHVEGYLKYWDDLLDRHPDMFIDSCASGGRRNDIETLRRAVPLLRSDWYWAPEGQQCQTYGLSQWMPYQGTGFLYTGKDKYWIRSCMTASLTFAPDTTPLSNINLDLLKQMSGEHRQIADCLLGDFYPLTPYSQSDEVWMAWQFDRPDQKKGVVQAFRRPRSIYESARVPLTGLDASATYEVTNLENNQVTKTAGRDLQSPGLLIALPTPASAVNITYRRLD